MEHWVKDVLGHGVKGGDTRIDNTLWESSPKQFKIVGAKGKHRRTKRSHGHLQPHPTPHNQEFRVQETLRRTGRRPSRDISVTDLDALRESRSQATLCPVCQKNSYQPTTALRIPRYRTGNHTLAHLYVVPVQYHFDGIRNCPHCRENPQERHCDSLGTMPEKQSESYARRPDELPRTSTK